MRSKRILHLQILNNQLIRKADIVGLNELLVVAAESQSELDELVVAKGQVADDKAIWFCEAEAEACLQSFQ